MGAREIAAEAFGYWGAPYYLDSFGGQSAQADAPSGYAVDGRSGMDESKRRLAGQFWLIAPCMVMELEIA